MYYRPCRCTFWLIVDVIAILRWSLTLHYQINTTTYNLRLEKLWILLLPPEVCEHTSLTLLNKNRFYDSIFHENKCFLTFAVCSHWKNSIREVGNEKIDLFGILFLFSYILQKMYEIHIGQFIFSFLVVVTFIFYNHSNGI